MDLQSDRGQTAHLSDLDGDGLADLVVKAVTDEVFYFGNEGRLSWGDRAVMAVSDVSPPSPFGAPGVRSADLDFDKGIDVIQGLNVGGGVAYRIWFNLGDQRYAPSLTAGPQGAFDLTDPAVQIADFNGDRVPDLIRLQGEQIEVKAGLGYGRFMDTRTVGLPDLTLTTEQIQKAKWTDLTGDGIDDLVLEQAAPGQLWYWVNLGNDQLTEPEGHLNRCPKSGGQNAVVRWADMNGNGTTDLVYADATSVPRLQTVDLGRDHQLRHHAASADFHRQRSGRTITIEYRSSIEFRLGMRPWAIRGVGSMPHLRARRIGRASGRFARAPIRRDFRYHDGYYDPVEKQFRGFRPRRASGRGRPERTYLGHSIALRHWPQLRVMKGRLLRLTAEQEDGLTFTDESTAWTLPPRRSWTRGNRPARPIRYRPSPRSETSRIHELGQGVPNDGTESEMEFDEHGNQTLEASYGVVEDGESGVASRRADRGDRSTP